MHRVPSAPPVGPGTYPAAPSSYANGLVRQPTGAMPWALGFLAFIPGVGILVAPVVVLLVRGSQTKHGELARYNATRAANWALTYMAVWILALVVLVVGLNVADTEDVKTAVAIFFGVLFYGMQVAHVVVTIIGTVQASKGREVGVTGFPVFR